MNGHRRAGDQDDSAHGGSSMHQPLLQRNAAQSPTKEESVPQSQMHRQWSRMTRYFANHPPTVGYMLFLSLAFGVSSGVVAFVYDTYFEAILTLVWEVGLFCLLSLPFFMRKYSSLWQRCSLSYYSKKP